jgi:hypothetical protein
MRKHLTYANVMATLAVVLVVGGGAAYAANTVFSADIVDGEVKTPDIAQNAVRTGEIGNGQVQSIDVKDEGLTSADLRADSVGSSEVADNSIQEGDLAPATRGARAYAYVDGAHCDDAVAFCSVTHSKRVDYAVHVAGGQWCVGVSGIVASDPSSLAVVTPDAVTGTTWARWRQGNSLCVASEFEIQTGNPTNFGDASFTIVIP